MQVHWVCLRHTSGNIEGIKSLGKTGSFTLKYDQFEILFNTGLRPRPTGKFFITHFYEVAR